MGKLITAEELRAWPTSCVVSREVFRRAAEALDAKDHAITLLRTPQPMSRREARDRDRIAAGMSQAGRLAPSDAPSTPEAEDA